MRAGGEILAEKRGSEMETARRWRREKRMKKKMESELYKSEKGNGEWVGRERWYMKREKEKKKGQIVRETVIF